MTKFDQVDFAQKAAQLESRKGEAELEYHDRVRTNWLTLNRLYYALDYAGKAANVLHGLKGKISGEPMESLFAQVAQEILDVESMVNAVDLGKAQKDAHYAGSLLADAQIAQQSGEALIALSKALEGLVQAQSRCAQTKTQREARRAPQRAKRKYAAVKADFVDVDGGGPVGFYKGQHCEIDGVFEGGIRVAAGNYSVFMTSAKVAQHFEIVEL